ncbi:MAG: acyl-CoA dehydratase activase [Desulfovibrio sp.]|nr:acyl-CoA dehydratase activase [Desulfovibrio sp.]
MISKSTYYVAGIDIGSAETKGVLLAEDSTVAACASKATGWNHAESASRVLDALWLKHGLSLPVAPEALVATGYGRISVPFADKTVTELSCHGRGALHLFPEVRTVIDIGGQDSKVIRLDGGRVRDFVMNDKCAAGTGRFVQNVATLFETDVAAFCGMAEGQDPCPITSMCAVFAETEIISLLARGKEPSSIASGVLHSIAKRIRALAGRFFPVGETVFSGGLARSREMGRILEEELGVRLNVPKHPQYTGALGAALFALERVKEQS